jgi:hypothetical protein
VAEQYAGEDGQCPACGRTLAIPATQALSAWPVTIGTAPIEIAGPLRESVITADDVSPPDEEPLPNHGGGRLPASSDFFTTPPEEIGPILSAHTTLFAGKRPRTPGVRLIASGLAGLAGLAAGSLIVMLFRPRGELWQILWPTVGSLLGVILGRVLTRFVHVCSYVGRDGVARYTCAGNRDRIVGSEVFLYQEAAELRTGQTARYNHGVYQGTDYTFTWTDAKGRTAYLISGTYRNAKGLPPTTDAFHYGRAAEAAWTDYLLALAPKRIKESGSVTFDLRKGQSLGLAPKRLTIQFGGEPVEWSASEIEQIVVDKGAVKIKRTDAQEGWFSSKGVLKIPLESLGNAQCFLRLADQLLGVRVS